MDDDDSYKVYKSPEQLANELITLSQLPESRWKNLINLDIIRVRQIFYRQFKMKQKIDYVLL
jgi:hypothetical protein